jgi:TFIIF-interacting CTD phosphatase-like protein
VLEQTLCDPEGQKTSRLFIAKRPMLDTFLRAVAARFEVVIFTASLSRYADPLLDQLELDSQSSGSAAFSPPGSGGGSDGGG